MLWVQVMMTIDDGPSHFSTQEQLVQFVTRKKSKLEAAMQQTLGAASGNGSPSAAKDEARIAFGFFLDFLGIKNEKPAAKSAGKRSKDDVTTDAGQ